MLRYKTETRPSLVALYDIRPGNGAGPVLQPRRPHGASDACIVSRVQRYLIDAVCNYIIVLIIMRPSSLGGGAYCVALCLSICLSVRLSVRPSRYRCHWLRLFGPASVTSRHLANYNDTEGRISYGHLGRTNSCYT